MFNDDYNKMNDFEKFIYLSDIFEPYVVDRIQNGKLVCEFKKRHSIDSTKSQRNV